MNKLNNPKTVLIFAPHPDDEVLGCGGYINHLVNQGHRVIVNLFTVGGPCSNASTEVRMKEAEEVAKHLGHELIIAPKQFEGYTLSDGTLSMIPNYLLTKLMDESYEKFEPDSVFCCYKSAHKDHIALYDAFIASIRLKSNFNPRNVYLYEYPFLLTSYDVPSGGKTYFSLTEDDMTAKVSAFELYKSQCKPKPSPLGVEGVEILARTRGLEIGERYAECFYCLRSHL